MQEKIRGAGGFFEKMPCIYPPTSAQRGVAPDAPAVGAIKSPAHRRSRRNRGALRRTLKRFIAD